MRRQWHTDHYVAYLKSKQWATKRQEKLESVNYSCDRDIGLTYQKGEDGILRRVTECSGSLEVHHRTYDNLGNEPLSDLTVLCTLHHEREHRSISEKNHFEKGLDTYATKKYGDDWQDYYDYEDIAEEFEEWREDANQQICSCYASYREDPSNHIVANGGKVTSAE